jgi:HlyD family secretion protein
MTASVDIITTRKENVLSVPLAAVTTRNPDDLAKNNGGGPGGNNDDDEERKVTDDSKPKAEKKEDKVVVFTNDNGVAKMIEVKTGISDYENIEIVSGLSEGTEIITGPFLEVSKRLKDGDKISLKKVEEKKEEEVKKD